MAAKKCVKTLSLWLLMLFFASESYAGLEYRGNCCQKRPVYDAPCAFEKIPVSREDVVCTPDGIFLKRCDGSLEKVRALSEDFEGMFVIRIQTQCSQCGRTYLSKDCPEGYSCPLYDQEVLPGIWVSP